METCFLHLTKIHFRMKVAARFHYLYLFLFLFFFNEIKATYPTCSEAADNPVLISIDGYSGTLPFDISPMPQPLGVCGIQPHNAGWIAFIAATSVVHFEIHAGNCSFGYPLPACNTLGVQAAVFSSCVPSWELLNCVSPGNGTSNILPNTSAFVLLDDLVVGEMYFLFLDGNCAAVCDYEISVIQGATGCSSINLDSPAPISGPTEVCEGESVVYSTIPVLGAATYEWTIPSGWSIVGPSDEATIDLIPTYANQPVVDICVSLSNHCSTSSSQECISSIVVTPQDFLINISGEIDCADPNATVLLEVDPPILDGTWSQNNNIIATGASVTVSQAGLYSFTNNSVLCPTTVSAEVESFNNATTLIQAVACSNCSTDQVILCIENIPAGYDAWWEFNGNIYDGNPQGQTVLGTGVWTAVASNGQGCPMTSEIEVTNTQNFPTNWNPNAGSDFCIPCNSTSQTNGNEFNFPSGFIPQWTTTNGNIVGNPNVFNAMISEPGTYVYSVINPVSGCGLSDTVEVTLCPIAEPVGPIYLNCFNGNETTLMTNGAWATDYEWNGPNGFFSTEENPITSVTGTYCLTASQSIASLSINCVVTNCIEVEEEVGFVIGSIDANCDISDGGAYVSIVGTNFIPEYAWSNGGVGDTILGLEIGEYTVTISGVNCDTTQTVAVVETTDCKARISGTVYVDTQSPDCQVDSETEPRAFALVKLIPNNIYTYTDANGYYEFFVDAGDYEVELIEHTNYTYLCPSDGEITGINLPDNFTFADGNDFYVKLKIERDLKITGFNNNVRPQFTNSFFLSYCNNSTLVENGTVTFIHDSALQNFQMTGNHPAPDVYDSATSTATWSFTNLQPQECRQIFFTMQVPAAVQVGQVVTNTASINPIIDDIVPSNNVYTWSKEATLSYDPNDKQEFSGETPFGGAIYLPEDKTLKYQIRFQNTGTDTAFHVVIKDELHPNLDVTTIRTGVSSHPYELKFEGNNLLIFDFPHIELPHEAVDEAGSQGFVTFTIDLKDGLEIGDEVRNDVGIYFDHNPPIITNEVVNTLEAHFFDIECNIHTMEDEAAENTAISITGDLELDFTIDPSGSFMLENLSAGGNYNFDFEKNSNLLNGVTTFDIVLIHRHIIGVAPLDSPYQLIAADANNSGHITTHDIVVIKSAILHFTDNFPNNTSWRFVDGNFDFTNPADPFLDDFPESISIVNLENDRTLDVVAIKVGDINGSASPNQLMQADDRGINENVLLSTENQELSVGEEVLVPFAAKDFNTIQAFQFTLEFSKENLKFAGFEKGVLENMSANDLNFSFHLDDWQASENGKVTFAYASPVVQNFTIGAPLFYLKFKILQKTNLQEVLNITKNPTDAIAYDEFGKTYNIALTFVNNVRKTTMQVYPNPTNDNLFLDFSIEKENEITLEIYNSFGQRERIIFQNKKYQQGISKNKINLDGLSSGTYFIYLKTKETFLVKRFVKL